MTLLYLTAQPGTIRSHAALLWADQPRGLLPALVATLVVLLALAWRINGSDHATALVARIAGWTPFGFLRCYSKRRNANASVSAFPLVWVEILRQNVRHYDMLTAAEQERLHELIQRFLQGRIWEGCRGQPINDEVRVTVAGQVCLLLLGRDDDDFDAVSSILVYPTRFQTERHSVLDDSGRAVLEGKADTLGQAVYRGPVILAWDEVVAGGLDPADGRNVVFHEFAHQLDFAGDAATSDEAELARRRRRQEVFAAEYRRLSDEVSRGMPTLLDPYGATNPAEFFAVATECFFEQPVALRARHSELYQVMQSYYGQDTARRFETCHVQASRTTDE